VKYIAENIAANLFMFFLLFRLKFKSRRRSTT